MNTYIQKDTTTIYVELDYLLDDNYTTGTTWDDYKAGLWVLLSDEQVAFRKANPTASVQEVFNMELKNYLKKQEIKESLMQVMFIKIK